MNRQRAGVRISPHLLAGVLHLPDGTEICGASWDFTRDQLVLHVSHTQLPQIPIGAPFPEVRVLITERRLDQLVCKKEYTSAWSF